jgi:hypothetical protein
MKRSSTEPAIESECRCDEEKMINYERKEKLDYIFEKEIIEI